ncbi:MAG: SGNH/GDSL hydrolase family protein [Alphaproteobacteria bacterium]|nr:SGNH/GDSL hydrolase family protein [Alphaproteobacteria bacterium]
MRTSLRPSPSLPRRLAVLLCAWGAIVLASEMALELALLGYAWRSGQNIAILTDRLLLARPLLGPLLPGALANRVRGLTGVDFVGDVDDPAGSRHYYPADALLGHRIAAQVGLTRALRDGSERQAWQVSTPQGFAAAGRVEAVYLVPKPADVYRVIMLGGSTVEGIGALSPDDNLPALLAGRLAQEPALAGRKLELINAGVGSYDLRDSFLYLFGELTRYQPDLVIAYVGWNDLMAAYEPGGRPALRQAHHDAASQMLNRGYDLLGGARLFAAAAARQALRLARQTGWFVALSRVLPAGAGVEAASPVPSAPAFAAAAKLHGLLLAMATAGAQQQGFAFAALLQPLMGLDGKPYTAAEQALLTALTNRTHDNLAARQAFYDAMRPLYAERADRPAGACLADLSHALANVPEQVYRDTGHLLSAGNAHMAEAIALTLRACGLPGKGL